MRIKSFTFCEVTYRKLCVYCNRCQSQFAGNSLKNRSHDHIFLSFCHCLLFWTAFSFQKKKKKKKFRTDIELLGPFD